MPDVSETELDADGDGRYDTTTRFQGGAPTRQEIDTRGDGRVDSILLSHFDDEGVLYSQELVTAAGTRPDKKLFVDAGGRIVRHCADTDGDGRLEMLLEIERDDVTQAVIDTDGDGFGDEREVYRGNNRIRLETDTNGDHRPDVVQYFEGQDIRRQDEDSDFDGQIDLRFEGDKPAPMSSPTEAPPPLPELKCGEFDDFWKRQR